MVDVITQLDLCMLVCDYNLRLYIPHILFTVLWLNIVERFRAGVSNLLAYTGSISRKNNNVCIKVCYFLTSIYLHVGNLLIGGGGAKPMFSVKKMAPIVSES